jgi:hypothetical protein
MHAVTSSRIDARVWLAVSIAMLVAATTIRLVAPSAFAPRVHIRWSPAVDDGRRASLEARFHLFHGVPHDRQTWEYDLADPSREAVSALVAHPDVADTHYIERSTGQIAADAPAGTVRLPGRPVTSLVHSSVFDWLMFFWAASVLVSGVWLASAADARD